ncbi:MAG: transglycosylase SLT domain-containing protein [Ahniella sp.]|nr:transglycosylase SLT domain-containing protein [Ahniella sp.]
MSIVRFVLSASMAAALLLLSACATNPRKAAGDTPAQGTLAEILAAETELKSELARWARGEGGGPVRVHAASERYRALLARCAIETTCDHPTAMASQSSTLALLQQSVIGADDENRNEPATVGDADAGSGPEGDLPELTRSVAMLKGQRLDEIIELNPAVKASMEEWLTWMRPNLLDAWENYQYLRHLMWPQYEQAGLPEALLFGIMAKESGGKVHAVSPAGAAGLLQFMPATAQRYGLGRAGFDERYDAEKVTGANVRYINDQLKLLNNDLELTLGAYNGGEGRMGRLSPRGSRPFWDQRVYGNLPPETRDYVPMVLAAAWLFMHPEQYGLELRKFDATPSSIKLVRTASINELAVCMGQFGNPRGWFRTIRNLNPRWEAGTRLPAGTELAVPATAEKAYLARCQSGVLAQTATELHDAVKPAAGTYRAASVAPAPSGSGSGRTHVVRRGETLHSIARHYGCAVNAVAHANGVRAPKYLIRAGQRLSVPACGRG